MPDKIGEVIESASAQFVAESYELHIPPPLGGLVKTSDGVLDIYGVVVNATTEGIEPGRRPLARGKEEKAEEDIYRQHPQLSKLLRTTFGVMVIGHGDGSELHHYLPPRPPRVHSFVYFCEADEMRMFTCSFDYLPMLLAINTSSGDEAIAACLRQASSAHDDPRTFLVMAGKELALLLGSELNRLNAILRRIRP